MKKDMKKDMTGPLSSIFGNAEAFILDQCLIVGNMEQTISMLQESTGLNSKTVQRVVKKFVEKGIMKQTRKIGHTQAYSFNVAGDLRELIKWATKYQFSRTMTV